MSLIIWATIAGRLAKRKGQDTRKPADATATMAANDAADLWRNSARSQVFFGLPTYSGIKVWAAMRPLSPTQQTMKKRAAGQQPAGTRHDRRDITFDRQQPGWYPFVHWTECKLHQKDTSVT